MASAALRDGGEQGFEALVDRWYGSCVRLARLIGSDEVTAHRAAREAWLLLIARFSELPEEAPAHLVALRATIDALAAKLAAGEVSPAYDATAFEAEGTRWAGWWRDDTSPEAWKEQPADEALARALMELEPALAAVVVLRDVEGLDPNDVEFVLELTPSDQRELLHRGRAALWRTASR